MNNEMIMRMINAAIDASIEEKDEEIKHLKCELEMVQKDGGQDE